MKKVLIALLLAIAPASAQQQTPSEQALGTKLMQELQSGLNCSASLIGIQKELEAAKAKIKELEAKAKPE